MIKFWKVKATEAIKDCGEIRRSNHKFTIGKEYICINSGFKEVKIYDDNENAITLCSPDRCGFGMHYPIYTNFFEYVENSVEYVRNKRLFRVQRIKVYNRNKYKIGECVCPRTLKKLKYEIVGVKNGLYELKNIKDNSIASTPIHVVDVYFIKCIPVPTVEKAFNININITLVSKHGINLEGLSDYIEDAINNEYCLDLSSIKATDLDKQK